jgi:hypothetical protein
MDGEKRYEAGAPSRIRTCDLRFRRAMLYPLSYGRTFLGMQFAPRIVIHNSKTYHGLSSIFPAKSPSMQSVFILQMTTT